jgi:hypothetical protein
VVSFPLAAGVFLAATQPVPFTFHDRADQGGRSVLHFRALELTDKPPRPVELPPGVGPGASFGLVPVGPALAFVWEPAAPGGGRLWLDADGDERLTAAEAHPFPGKELTTAVTLIIPTGGRAQRLERTLVFRKSSAGVGLSYAVRGYAMGKLTLGGRRFLALLTDGDADGCFHGIGQDRVWIDLDEDGRFDPLTEQFLLGTAVTCAGKSYVIRPDAAARAVRVQERPGEVGRVRLSLGKGIRGAERFSAHLVSDFGELVRIEAADESVPVPVGSYRVDSLTVQLADRRRARWHYRFAGGPGYDVQVAAGKETTACPLQGLALSLEVRGLAAAVRPGQSLAVTPRLATPCGLYLADCTVRREGRSEPTPTSATIVLRGPGREVLDQASSGFL